MGVIFFWENILGNFENSYVGLIEFLLVYCESKIIKLVY